MTGSVSAAIEFRVLGRVEAVRNGSALEIGGLRQCTLLALLLIEAGRAIPTERLIDELWVGKPPAGADTTLRSYVSRLRRVLGDGIVINGGPAGYVLEIDPDRVDSARFERVLKEGEEALARGATQRAAERLAGALSLWRGRAFGNVADEGALRLEAERLEELRLRALEHRVEADLALGKNGELVEELEALVQRHPYRERFCGQLMLALYRAGRQADALEAFRQARAQLVGELGIEPGQELRQLEQAILRHEVDQVIPPEQRHNLPAPVTSFVGRKVELAELSRLLQQHRLLTLTGVGGAGKTRLALELARQLLPDFPDGVWFCDLAPIAEGSLVAPEVARLLEVHEQPDVALQELLANHLQRVGPLLVLDNCEHLREVCSELADGLLARSPGLRILATSRVPLGAAGEVDYDVPPLAVPSRAADLDELRSSEAVRLFVARAQAARPRLRADALVLTSAGEICRDLDGLPLAIELAAARAKAMSLEDIATRLTDRFRFLVSWRRLSPARHRTLREAMDWSYELLSDDERSFLARLSAFSGGCTLAATARVCCDGDALRALELIERLVEASLVIAEEREGDMRYRLLETVREYAAQRLGEAGAASTERSHADYYFELAEQRSREVEERGLLTPLASLGAEDGNLLATLQYLQRSGDSERQLRLCGALWRLWWLRGQLAEGRRRLETALARSTGKPSPTLARALRGASHLAHRQGDLRAAVALGEKSAEISRKLNDPLSLARAQMAVANAASTGGDFGRAEKLYRESAGAFRAANAGWDLATVLLNIGDLALVRGDLDETERVATESLAFFRATGDDSGAAANLGNIGFVLLQRGEPEKAREALAGALRLADRLGFAEWIATMIQGLAAVAGSLAEHRRAAQLLGASARLREEIGVSLDSFEERLHARTLASIQEHLDAASFDKAFAVGSELSTADAVADALSSM